MENNNVEIKNTGKNVKKVGIGAAILTALLGGGAYLLCKAKKNRAENEAEEFTSDTVIDEIPGDGEVE